MPGPLGAPSPEARDPLIPTRLSNGDRVWIAVAASVALAAGIVRIYNVYWFDTLLEPDGMGHALHVLAWYEGRLPDPRSWSGFHPPLYYMLGAGLWHLLPDAMPVHVGLRALSAAFGAAAVWMVWRTLRHCLPLVDATVVAVLAWCIPFMALVTSAVGNETLGALIVTALLVRMMRVPQDDASLPRHALGTGALAGLGLLAKSTSLIALGAAGLTYLIRLRATPLRAAQAGAITALAAFVVAAPHYVRIAAVSGGSPLSAFSAAAVSPDVKAVMDAQPPGERRLVDYVSLPAATLLQPHYTAPGMTNSVPGLLYASVWADGHGSYLPIEESPQVLRAQVWMAFAGLLPTVLLLVGVVRVARNFEIQSAWLCPMILLAALFVAFLGYSLRYPTYAAVKARYMLPALLPLTYLTGQGLTAAAPSLRAWLRVALLAIAIGATALTFWGWWFSR
jgi:hypothetical protein